MAVKQCPNPGELSELVDGGATPAIADHVQHCAACAAICESYRRIDTATKGALMPPSGLAVRIKERCRALDSSASDTGAPRPIPFWSSRAFQYALAVASVVVLLGTLTLPLLPLGQATGGGQQAAQVEPSVHTPGAGVVAPPAAAHQPVGEPRPALWTMAPEDGGNLMNAGNAAISRVATDGSPGYVATMPAKRGMRQRDAVPARVRHVWVAADLANAKGAFVDALPAETSYTVLDEQEGTVAFQVILPDYKLQKLVDELSEVGLPLVSPAVPQPGGAADLLVTGRSVRYDVEFVRTE